MAGTKIATKDMDRSKSSDWNQSDEDDDWDDWGDAEEILEEHNDKNKPGMNSNKDIDKEVETIITPPLINKEMQKEETHSNEKCTTPQQENKYSWGKSLWGTVMSTASDITSSVSQVIGVPDPEQLARINSDQQQIVAHQKVEKIGATETKTPEGLGAEPNHTAPLFGLSLVNGVTNLGSKVISTGLDTLEGIGKKTMNILQENDPLLMNKRKLLGLEPDRPNLSAILKEAKLESDQIENTLRELKIEKNKSLLRFDVIFENSCGLVHLEALEILSKESNLKLKKLKESVSGNALAELEETVNEVKELLELEDLEVETEGNYTAHELNENLQAAIEDAELKITFDDIVNIWSKSIEWFAEEPNVPNEEDAFGRAVTALAETCALEINKLHKIAELLLVKEHHSTANEVDGIVQLCKQFNTHLNGLTNRYAAVLTSTNSSETKSHISTLFSEMLLATQQIERAFKLFLPILQIGAV